MKTIGIKIFKKFYFKRNKKIFDGLLIRLKIKCKSRNYGFIRWM